jgi:hypothetical protein
MKDAASVAVSATAMGQDSEAQYVPFDTMLQAIAFMPGMDLVVTLNSCARALQVVELFESE